MLRVLTLSTLFPNAVRPTLGVFVERQTLGLAARADVELEMVAPVGLPVWPLSLHPHYAPLRTLPRQEELERAEGPPSPLPRLAADRRGAGRRGGWPMRCCRSFARYGRASRST